MANSAPPDPVFGSAMREMSRAHIADIWRRGRGDEPMSDEDRAFFEAMQAHPEYAEIWEGAAELAGKDVQIQGTNPFLHASLHTVIEQQIRTQQPAETGRALFRLTHAGIDRHEAVHRLAGVLTELMWETIRRGRPFEPATYERRLRGLKP